MEIHIETDIERHRKRHSAREKETGRQTEEMEKIEKDIVFMFKC